MRGCCVFRRLPARPAARSRRPGHRLMRTLAGGTRRAVAEQPAAQCRFRRRSIGAAELLDYDRSRLRGLVLEEGPRNRHVAIVARTLRRRRGRRCPGASGPRRSGDPNVVESVGEVDLSAPPRNRGRLYRQGPLRARRAASIRELRDRPARPRRPADRADDQCRPADRPAARRGRAAPASACSAPSCSS